MPDEIQFGKLVDDGFGNMHYEHVRALKQSDMMKCPFIIMVPEHYHEDGTCKCWEADEQYRMYHEWEYRKADFHPAGIPYLLGPRGARKPDPHLVEEILSPDLRRARKREEEGR